MELTLKLVITYEMFKSDRNINILKFLQRIEQILF